MTCGGRRERGHGEKDWLSPIEREGERAWRLFGYRKRDKREEDVRWKMGKNILLISLTLIPRLMRLRPDYSSSVYPDIALESLIFSSSSSSNPSACLWRHFKARLNPFSPLHLGFLWSGCLCFLQRVCSLQIQKFLPTQDFALLSGTRSSGEVLWFTITRK